MGIEGMVVKFEGLGLRVKHIPVKPPWQMGSKVRKRQ